MRPTRAPRHRRIPRLIIALPVSLLAFALAAPGCGQQPHTASPSAARSGGSLPWNGDFDTGDLSQWVDFQGQSPDRAKIITSPVIEGKYALSLTTKYGDLPLSPDTNRSQLNGPYIHQEGEEDYTRVSMRVPTGFPVGTASNDFQLAYQWHGDGDCGSGPGDWSCFNSPTISVGMTKDRSRWKIDFNPYAGGSAHNQQRYYAVGGPPLTKDKWHHFVLRTKWSHDPSVGFIEAWHAEEGQTMQKITFDAGPGAGTQRTPGSTLTMQHVDGVAPRAANYRLKETTTQDGTIYYDGIKVGTTFESVAP